MISFPSDGSQSILNMINVFKIKKEAIVRYRLRPKTSRPCGALLIHSFSTKNGMIRLHGVFFDP